MARRSRDWEPQSTRRRRNSLQRDSGFAHPTHLTDPPYLTDLPYLTYPPYVTHLPYWIPNARSTFPGRPPRAP
jgi:hypothetical protein